MNKERQVTIDEFTSVTRKIADIIDWAASKMRATYDVAEMAECAHVISANLDGLIFAAQQVRETTGQGRAK